MSSPIDSLPAELLIEIFVFYARTDALAPLILGRICTFWRQVVAASPHIWQTILLDDTARSIAASQAQIRRWIDLSNPLPFDIQLSLSTSENLLTLLAPCLPHLSRWRQFTLRGQREESVTIKDLNMVSLDRLLISVGPEYDALSDTAPKSTFVEYSPLWPGVMALDVAIFDLPRPHTIPCLHFTTLDIMERSLDIQLSPESLLGFLQACPNVRTLSYTGCIPTDMPYIPSSTVAHLPHLTSLTIRTTNLTRALLSGIDAPCLSELYLSLLNVDTELPNPEPHEDGDEEDEHPDFSLSPSSDRATGMGLRRLIARCNPPIRALEMNFSDMRTKDFTHVFERLPTIEEFIIVASDLSNTVIKLFSHCLPKLRKMELHSCHRFDGDAVVDALRSRKVGPRLDEIVISACERFDDSHALVLRKEFGDRFMED